MEEKSGLASLVHAAFKTQHQVIKCYHIKTNTASVEEPVIEWIINGIFIIGNARIGIGLKIDA